MATSIAHDRERGTLPKRGPTWTFYLLSAFALLVVVATIFGLLYAKAPG
jgi:hypothetical protein